MSRAGPRVHSRRFPHLPPGHEPGPQSRRRTSQRTFVVAALVVLAGFFVVVGFLFEDPAAPRWFFPALAGAFALGCLLLARRLWRRARPPARRDFAVTVDVLEVRRGGDVAVQVPGAGDGVEVGLECVAYHDFLHVQPGEYGGATRQTSETIVHEEWAQAGSEGGVQLRPPPDAPFSYEGSALSFAWRVTVRQSGRVRRRRVGHQPIWVRP